MAAQRPAASMLPLAAMGVLLAVTLLTVGVMRWNGVAPDAEADTSAVIAARQLRFADEPDGSIIATDAQRGVVAGTIAPGSNGFLRATMRGLAQERMRRGIGDEQPFALSAHADGRLTLVDPATGRRIDLEAFGATNAGAFALLLPHPRPLTGKQP